MYIDLSDLTVLTKGYWDSHWEVALFFFLKLHSLAGITLITGHYRELELFNKWFSLHHKVVPL